MNMRIKDPVAYDPEAIDREIEERFRGLLFLQRGAAESAFYRPSIAECEKIMRCRQKPAPDAQPFPQATEDK
jgi:hypothetical protein